MRLKMWYRRFSYTLRRCRRGLGLALAALGAAVILLATVLTSRLDGTFVELALAAATDDITIAVNETVAEVMEAGKIDYKELVTLERDASGAVTALVTNVANINILQAEVTNAVVERFSDSDITAVEIPLGNFIGGALFSGRGPRVRLDILSVTNVTTSFRNDFSSAGINQTRHRIIMDVDVTLEVLLGRGTGTDSVTTEISVAETVIVGAVPGAYAAIS